MKKFLVFLIIIFIYQCFYSQENKLLLKQVEHKYVTVQAWNIVKAEHPEVSGTAMDEAMGPGDWWWNGYDGDRPWSGKILITSYKN